tara:strand:- start:79 stop:447 length:369 start_codon:yes stop_codon:yes gene_type:complete
MMFIQKGVSDFVREYGVVGCWSLGDCETAEKAWDTLKLMEEYERPDKEEFIKKVNERCVYYQMEELRRKRDELLKESDWTQSKDLTLTNDEAWKKYRQELRDLPQTITDIAGNEVEYPSKPI